MSKRIPTVKQVATSARLRRVSQLLTLLMVGGYALQLVGCTAGAIPVILSLAESTALSLLLGSGTP
ncbi:MAG: hypothetical protein ACE5E5_10115 [Phycisphaerae bacterium]